MRMPGEEIAHAAGFCLGEGLIDRYDDLLAIGFCADRDPNVVDVRLRAERRAQIPDILERRGFVSQTSCGICGKEMVEDLYQIVKPVQNAFRIPVNDIMRASRKLEQQQVHYKPTRGSHAALILNARLDTLALAEDVGRHNALDKAIGKLVVGPGLENADMVVLSSRLSYELVQKAARAGLALIIGKSRPTALAVEMGKALNMTLVCHPKGTGPIIFCGRERIMER